MISNDSDAKTIFGAAANLGDEAAETDDDGGNLETEYMFVFNPYIGPPFLSHPSLCNTQPHPKGPCSGSIVISAQPSISRQACAHLSSVLDPNKLFIKVFLFYGLMLEQWSSFEMSCTYGFEAWMMFGSRRSRYVVFIWRSFYVF